MRRGVVLGVLAIGGCLDPIAYPCSAPQQCRLDGEAGTCHSTGWCVYPDSACPSGQRYGPAAGDGRAEDCAPDDTVGTSASSSSASDTSDGCGECEAPPGPCFAAEGTCDGTTLTCEYEQLAAGTACDDDDPCTLGTTCDDAGVCVPSETLVCDTPPSPTCVENPGTCAEDGCTYAPLPAGSRCEDGDACTIGDSCSADGVCLPGEICVALDMCATGVCVDGACMFTPLADGTSCGANAADRCCAGTCVDIASDAEHCGGCGAACQPGEACESVADTVECDPHPAATSGRCTCNAADSDCPAGQICRTLTPAANRCTPGNDADCPSGAYVDVQLCPNYCVYE